jgi:hypothetical protein
MTLELKDILGPAVALIAVGWGLLQYRATSKNEFIKPIREAQLRLYIDATSAAANLATLPKEGTEWQQAYNKFHQLYYGPLTIFEDYEHSTSAKETNVTVEEAMIAFKACLDDPSCERLKDLSLALGHTCRSSLGASWGYDVPQLQGDYQRLIRSKQNENR